jgi:hypothetical protein
MRFLEIQFFPRWEWLSQRWEHFGSGFAPTKRSSIHLLCEWMKLFW